MKFDVYNPIRTKEGSIRPGVKPIHTEWATIKRYMASKANTDLIDRFRETGDKEYKNQLPAVCYVGECTTTRANSNMLPTQVIMLDVDHVKAPRKAFEAIEETMCSTESGKDWWYDHVLLWAITPSGEGLRGLVWAVDDPNMEQYEGKDYRTLECQMQYYNKILGLSEYGDFDAPCKDFARISFYFKPEEILFENAQLMTEMTKKPEGVVVNAEFKEPGFGKARGNDGTLKKDGTFSASLFKEESVAVFTEEEVEKFENFEYRDTPVKIIIEKYVEQFGEPGSGEKHPYYNEMVKNFRCICENNQRLLLYLLPRFGHTIEECASQIRSICKVNTLSSLPKKFYFFLKDNGFYKPRESASEQGRLKEYMMSEKVEDPSKPPYLPPIFKQLVGIAPPDFVDPAINALLPILGTLTSYAQAVYPYDDRMHTTSFFSVIYAPPGTGKGFVERYMDLLFQELKVRDFVQSERENVYLRFMNKKSDNDKGQDIPHTSLRLIPPKNSESEFLQKQRDNHGYHMFTYAAEMDSWAKGVKAAGGNKDDMIRVAWDNGEYGQQFKSTNTFKGTVNLFWNVLITGTLQQLEAYFKNVENGLVTRCSFTGIENQEFVLAPKWKKLTDKSKAMVRKFAMYCDSMTYETPCTIVPEDLASVSDEDFDKEVDWRFKFKPHITMDCSWIMPTIDKFHKEHMTKAALDVDKARDVFRRRVGVRGFRLALMCMCLWEHPQKADLEKCKLFIRWWMDRDLEWMLKLWGAKYNEQADTTPKLVQRTVFNELPETFNRNDMYVVCTKQGIKTPIRRIVFDWKKLGYIEQVDKDTFKKKKK